jgi:hypothetical protein
MRRALVGIVPDEVLNRKRKAYVGRGPFTSISAQWTDLIGMTQHMVSDSLGMVDKGKFVEALQRARQGQEVEIVILMRTVLIESWLTSHRDWSLSTFSHWNSSGHLGDKFQCENTQIPHPRKATRVADADSW